MASEAVVQRPVGRVRSTRQAGAIETLLAQQDGFRTASELYTMLRAEGDKVGLTTVYRHLNLLAELGSADVVHTPAGEASYRLCERPGHVAAGGHCHHLVCRVCGRSEEIDGPEVEAWAERVSAKAGYTDVAHTVELFGLCPQHSAKKSRRR